MMIKDNDLLINISNVETIRLNYYSITFLFEERIIEVTFGSYKIAEQNYNKIVRGITENRRLVTLKDELIKE